MPTRYALAIRAVADAIISHSEAIKDAEAALDDLYEAIDAESAEDLPHIGRAVERALSGRKGWGFKARALATGQISISDLE